VERRATMQQQQQQQYQQQQQHNNGNSGNNSNNLPTGWCVASATFAIINTGFIYAAGINSR